MKKFISLLLVMTMVFALSAPMSFAADDTFSLIVASDPHYDYDRIAKVTPKPELLMDALTGDYDINTAFITQEDTYSHINTSGQLFYESGAILDEFLKQAAENKTAKFVLITGDLTNNGSRESSEAMAAKLRAFETSTGKSVYVIPGNHEVQVLKKSEFKEIYNAFGYAEALAQDSSSASYTADLPGGYRLLCIDTTGEEKSGYEFSNERLNWVKAQCEQAKKDKKHLIAAMHHNILQHFAFDFIHRDATIDNSYGLKELFCEYDVKYTFSGHTHAQDIMQYKGSNGNIIYEVVNGALNSFPLSYRVVDFSNSQVKFSSKNISSVDTSSFANMKYTVGDQTKRAISDAAISHANSDFRGYAHTAFRYAVKELFSDTLRTGTLKKYLGVDYSQDTEEDKSNYEIALIIDKIGNKMEEILKMPLYTKDKDTMLSVSVQAVDRINGQPLFDENGKPVMVAKYSVQEISESYGGIIPPSHYKDLVDVLVLLYETHVSGGEGLTYNSDEFFITIHGIAAALNYCLYSISEAEYGRLIRFIASKFEPTILGKIPSSVYSYMASGKEGFEQNIILMTYLLAPWIKGVVSDSIPSDKDITLPAYTAYEVPEEKPVDNSIKGKFAAFFDKFVEFFRMLFKVLTFQGVFG